MLNDKLQWIKLGRTIKSAVTAYADDVTVFLSSPSDVKHLQEAMQCYERAVGAKINLIKSKVLALGSWDQGLSILDIPYHDTVTILGMEIKQSLRVTSKASWSKVIILIKAQTTEDYSRDLNFTQWIQYVHGYLHARALHMAKIHIPPEDNIRQINAAIARFLWQGEVFRVPLTTLYRTKKRGWGLFNLSVRCRALLFYLLQKQLESQDTLTSIWMRHWNIAVKKTNPPHTVTIPHVIDWLLTKIRHGRCIHKTTRRHGIYTDL
jgi:hypothetical protein